MMGICHSRWTWLIPGLFDQTSGRPSPYVVKAMFTPSLVFAYLTCGSMAQSFYDIIGDVAAVYPANASPGLNR